VRTVKLSVRLCYLALKRISHVTYSGPLILLNLAMKIITALYEASESIPIRIPCRESKQVPPERKSRISHLYLYRPTGNEVAPSMMDESVVRSQPP
jgi:hypothetical protein